MFLNTGLHLLLYASFLNHPEGSHDHLCGESERGEQSQFTEEICCGERLSSEVGSRADSGTVFLTCFPLQWTPTFTVQGWSGPGWLPDRNIPGQQWAFWKPCVLTPVHCFSVFVPSIITTVSLDTISNPIHFTVFFFLFSHEPYNNTVLPNWIHTRKCRRTSKQETWALFQKKTKW